MFLLKKYRKYKKNKYEKEIKEFIKYNNKVIQKYKNNKSIRNYCVGKSFSITFYGELEKKYKIKRELLDEMFVSYRIAIREYTKMEERIENKKLEKENKEKVRLYKKAILELKKEGMI